MHPLGHDNSASIEVSDFGPLAHAKIQLKPLTVFTGRSNTGKSYLATLLYALHRFFSGRLNGAMPASLRHQFPFIRRFFLGISQDDRNTFVSKMNKCFNDSASTRKHSRAEETLPVLLPKKIFILFWPLFEPTPVDCNLLETELSRCFGVSSIDKLTRRSSTNESRIAYHWMPSFIHRGSDGIQYNFRFGNSEKEFIASLPTDLPLPISQPIKKLRWVAQAGLHRIDQEHYIDLAASLILKAASPCILGPISNHGHYLPADRTGIVHAHQVIVSSLIQRASWEGIRVETPIPSLSGVVSDFLGRLVELGTLSPASKDTNNTLADQLERQILKGRVTVNRSIPGYPTFEYHLHGWDKKERLALMNSSAMISEIAPVVLYLRYIVGHGEVLIIEEPEAHLHPEAQVDFFQHLVRIVNSGIRVIITTHSDS